MTVAQFKLDAYNYETGEHIVEYHPFGGPEVKSTAIDAAYEMSKRLKLSVAFYKPFMLGYIIDQTVGDFGHITDRSLNKKFK